LQRSFTIFFFLSFFLFLRRMGMNLGLSPPNLFSLKFLFSPPSPTRSGLYLSPPPLFVLFVLSLLFREFGCPPPPRSNILLVLLLTLNLVDPLISFLTSLHSCSSFFFRQLPLILRPALCTPGFTPLPCLSPPFFATGPHTSFLATRPPFLSL